MEDLAWNHRFGKKFSSTLGSIQRYVHRHSQFPAHAWLLCRGILVWQSDVDVANCAEVCSTQVSGGNQERVLNSKHDFHDTEQWAWLAEFPTDVLPRRSVRLLGEERVTAKSKPMMDLVSRCSERTLDVLASTASDFRSLVGNQTWKSTTSELMEWAASKNRKAVENAHSSRYSEWNVDKTWSSQEWKSEVWPDVNAQHTDRFIFENDKMNSYTEAESELSLESRSLSSAEEAKPIFEDQLIKFSESGHPVFRATIPLSEERSKTKEVENHQHTSALMRERSKLFLAQLFYSSAHYPRSSLRFVWRMQSLPCKNRETCYASIIWPIVCADKFVDQNTCTLPPVILRKNI